MIGILAAFISFTLFVPAHWAVCHWLRWRPLAKALNGLWLANLVVYDGFFFYVFAAKADTLQGIVNFLNGLLIEVFLLIGYTAFFFLIERGLSLRVLIEISRAPQQRMTIDDIKRVYPYDYILEKRLAQMLTMGYSVKRGDYFYSTDKGRRFAAAHKFVWKTLCIGKD